MASESRFPLTATKHRFYANRFQPGREKTPLSILLTAESYTNSKVDRSDGGDLIATFVLPAPKMLGNGVNNNYNAAPAKERSILAKVVSGEGKSVWRDFVNIASGAIEDAFNSFTGVDYGKIPMDMSESTFQGTTRRGWKFNWDLIALNKKDSNTLIQMAQELSSYSLPRAEPRSTRMQAPPMWRISMLQDNGSSNRMASKALLGDPKICILQEVTIVRNVSSMYAPGEDSVFPTPLSISIELSFTEIEPVFGTEDGQVRSRSESLLSGGYNDGALGGLFE